MKTLKGEQTVNQLEKRKGGYYFLKIHADFVNQFEKKRHTRFICKLDNIHSFQCGLNHLGDGNYFIIISKKNLKSVNKQLGDTIQFELWEDPNPLGVDMPEVLTVLLEQDELLREKFERLTLGKQRSVIFYINKTKDIDKQISNAIEAIQLADKPRKKK